MTSEVKLDYREKRNANLMFVSRVLSSLAAMFIGFLTIKLTIAFYGESINGLVRFISQIFAYLLIFINSISTVFSIHIIKYYKQRKWNYIYWISKYMHKVWIYLGLFYAALLMISGIAISFLLSSTEAHITILFVFMLFGSIAIQSFFTAIFMNKYTIFYTSINKGYVPTLINLGVRVVFYAYFLIIVIVLSPLLHTTIDPETHTKIVTFDPGDWRVYSIAIAFAFNALTPLLSSLILHFKYKKDYFIYLPNKYEEISNVDIKLIKKDIWHGLKFSLILTGAGMITTSTDEFVILLLRTDSNDNYIYKLISIYGIYSTVLLSFFNILNSYVISKKVLIGLLHSNSKERTNFMNKLKLNIYLLGSISFLICVLFVPVFINILFNPTSDPKLYLNFNFSLPFAFLFIFGLLYWPDYLMVEVDNKFKWLAWLASIESILNLILSLALVRMLGIYWVIWASVISRFIKLVLIKIVLMRKYDNFRFSISQFLNKKMYIIFSLISISFILLSIIYYANSKEIFDIVKDYLYIFIAITQIFVLSFIIILIYKNMNKNSKNA